MWHTYFEWTTGTWLVTLGLWDQCVLLIRVAKGRWRGLRLAAARPVLQTLQAA